MWHKEREREREREREKVRERERVMAYFSILAVCSFLFLSVVVGTRIAFVPLIVYLSFNQNAAATKIWPTFLTF